jgi:folate-dependent phosphoribosylglycinamide formyltransferase PurN
MLKLGILASESLSEFRVNTLLPFLSDKNFELKVVFIDKRPKKTIKQKLRKNFKRGRGGYMLVMALKSILAKKEATVDTRKFCNEKGIEVIETIKPYSKEFIETVRSHDLDALLLLGGYGIVKTPLLEASRLGVISYHHGNMRTYRGMPPGLWELYNNEKEMGVTVQILSPGLDCGIPVEERNVIIKKNDTVATLEKRALKESEDMLHKALVRLSNPAFTPQKLESFGRVYTLPNMTQWIKLNLKIWSRKMKLS